MYAYIYVYEKYMKTSGRSHLKMLMMIISRQKDEVFFFLPFCIFNFSTKGMIAFRVRK